MKLNLGCGHIRREGYVNVDKTKNDGVDVVWDLDTFPYPFDKASAEEIIADNVLEHVYDPLETMIELHRILKDGGRLTVKVPHFSRGFTCVDHKRGFDVTFPYYFSNRYKENVGVQFQVKKIRINWFYANEIKRSELNPAIFYTLIGIGSILDFFANLSQYFCSRIWCYWVGGFDTIDFEFIKPERRM